MNAYVLDSNILIYHLQGALDDKEEALLSEALSADAYISVISRIEVLGWRGHTDESLEKAQQFLDGLYCNAGTRKRSASPPFHSGQPRFRHVGGFARRFAGIANPTNPVDTHMTALLLGMTVLIDFSRGKLRVGKPY